MFTDKEITLIVTILSQIQFKVGQSDDMKTVENIIKKGQEHIQKLQKGN